MEALTFNSYLRTIYIYMKKKKNEMAHWYAFSCLMPASTNIAILH